MANVAEFQKTANRFTTDRLLYVGNLRVDGDMGPATKERIKKLKWWLGYPEPRLPTIDPKLVRRLRHPQSLKYSSAAMVARGMKRRRAQRRAANKDAADGVVMYDGKPVAAWMVRYLNYARQNGWMGWLVSGFRSPEHSEQLCFAMCGRPSCPGMCAGRSSNHTEKDKPGGALDVSFYEDFGERMRECPFEPKLFNALGARDPVHYSSTGR
jgi:hypothetical protein